VKREKFKLLDEEFEEKQNVIPNCLEQYVQNTSRRKHSAHPDLLRATTNRSLSKTTLQKKKIFLQLIT
jgi:hypothetical protein